MAESRRPNVIYIMADDIGYGDAKPFGQQRCLVETPGISQLAREGMRFTDAHTIACVCIPSRVAIMTGRYPWRIRGERQSGPWGFVTPRVPTDHFTLGKMLQQAGYSTGYVGKWHLGTTMQTTDSQTQGLENVDYQLPLTVGPRDYGFDYSFILPGSLDMFPYVFVRNHEFVGHVTKQRGWSAFNRIGPTEENFEDYLVLDTFSSEVESFIANSANAAKQGKPFFLYFALTAPHTPISPHPDFQGTTPLGNYGDFLQDTDHCVVRTLAALKQHGLDQNTIVIFTSDHGPGAYAGNRKQATFNNIKMLEQQGHFPSGIYRGYKFSIYEGGFRVPFVIKWPGTVKPGSTCNRLVGLNDLMATLAEITGTAFTDNQAVDSISYLPLLKNPHSQGTRKNLMMASTHGYALRTEKWKLALCPGSGSPGKYGNTPAASFAWHLAIDQFGRNPTPEELSQPAFVQLFDMVHDEREQHNIAKKHPTRIQNMVLQMQNQFATGRSTPGPQQPNDFQQINFWARIPSWVLQKETPP